MKKENKPGTRRADWNQASEPLLKPFTFDGWGYEAPPLDLAERRAKLEEPRAEFAEKGPFPDGAKERREAAAWWRNLANCPEEKVRPAYEQYKSDARDAIDSLLVRAEGNEGPLVHLFSIAFDLLHGLHALAANGNKKAAAVWANTLANSIEDFVMLAFHKPAIIEEWARGSTRIPGLITTNAEMTKSNAELVKRLQVGADCDVAIVPTGKRGRTWKFHGTANGLAMRLKSHIDSGRTLYSVHELQAQAQGQKIPAWLRDAMKLEAFSPKTWNKWAEVAWDIVMEATGGHPETHPELRPLGESAAKKKSHKGRVHPAAQIRAKIKERLGQAFKLIAAK